MTAQLTARTLGDLPIPQPGTFNIDPAHTVVGASVRHLMVSKVRGKFAEVSGVITIADAPLESSVEVSIVGSSIDTGNADRDNHLRSADFLDVATYPQLTFRSSRIVKQDGHDFVLAGDLTIHGVTREIELEVEYHGVAVNPWGAEVIGFSVKGEFDREDFGMSWNAALETGGVLVSKKVTIEIEAEAVRQA